VRKALFLGAAAVGLSLTAAACNPIEPYAALVNGQAITQTALNQELEAVRSSPQVMQTLAQNQLAVTGAGQETFSSDFAAQVLRGEIFYALIHQEVVRRRLTVTGADLASARQDAAAEFGSPGEFQSLPGYYQDVLVHRSADANALAAAIGRVHLGAAAIAAYYAAHRAEYVEACVQHILVATQAEAAQVKADLAAGKPFDQEAAAKSTDTGSAANGGRLGCGPANQYVAPFAHAVETLPVGVVSDPVQSQFGWHIIEVTARTQQPLSAVESQIRQQLLSNASQSLNGFLQQASARADIVVNARYGTWVRSGPNGPGVQPPQAPNVRSDGPGSGGQSSGPSGGPSGPPGPSGPSGPSGP